MQNRRCQKHHYFRLPESEEMEEITQMKHGKNPTREQKKLISKWRMDPAMWLVVKDTPDFMELVHRYSDQTRKRIPKRRDEDG